MSEFKDNLDAVKGYLTGLQDSIVAGVERLDGKATFARDVWERQEGGGGISRVLTDGALMEQAGIGFSHVMGDNLPPSATKARP